MERIEVLLKDGFGSCEYQVTDRDMSEMAGLPIGFCQVSRILCRYGGDAVACHLNGGPAVFNDFCGVLDERSPFLRTQSKVRTKLPNKKRWFGL